MWLVNPFLWEQPTGQNGKQDLPGTWALHAAQTYDSSLSEILLLHLGLRHTHDTTMFSGHTYPSWPTHTASHTFRPITSPLPHSRQKHLSKAGQGMMLQNALSDNNYKTYHLSSAYSAQLLCQRHHVYVISFNHCDHLFSFALLLFPF